MKSIKNSLTENNQRIVN